MPASQLGAPVDQRTVMKLVRQGVLHRDIAERLGVSRARISQIAAAHGHSTPISRRQSGLRQNTTPDADEAAILEKLLAGASRNTTAIALGVTYYAVEKVATKYRAQHPIISAPKHGRSPPRDVLPVPAWAHRAGLADDYRDHTRVFGEHEAARHCRALNRAATAEGGR